MNCITRRQILGGATALAALAPLRLPAQAGAFAAAFDRAKGLDQLHALAVARGGEVVAADALRGPSIETPVNIKSASKTIVAALTGLAIDRGELAGVDATLGEVAPGLVPAAAAEGVRDITIEDLVTMRAGLERTSGGNYGGWVSSADWVADALSRPLVADPGEDFLYSTGSFHILGAVLSEVSGSSLLDIARARLGTPLDIRIPPWTRDPQGRYMGGNEMALSPLAMIAFGEAYRTREVIPVDWVEASWEPRARSPFSGDGYGYGWFLRRVGDRQVFYARGYGGQMIYVVPDLDLTVAVTSDPNRPARSDGHVGALNALLAEAILPEAEREA